MRAADRRLTVAAIILLGVFGAGDVAVAAASAEGAVNAAGSVRARSAAGVAGGAASLAAANAGKSAGKCAVKPSVNSLGGSAFDGSCAGYNGKPEYWCADFAMWVWQNSGLYSAGLTAGAGSFAVYGQTNGTLHTSASYVPQPGDAVVYDYDGKSYADHVAIVTAINSDGSVVTANGDWNGGASSSEVVFATNSSVVSVTIPASQRAVGTIPSTVDPGAHYRISAYVTPLSGAPGSSPAPVPPPAPQPAPAPAPVPAPASNPFTPSAVCGTGYSVVDSHDLGSATIYLLYNATSGNNCVTTLTDNPSGPVPMNATLSVQGGASGADQGTYTDYAGPVAEPAASACVEWGGSYQAATWTSAWSHCG